MYNHLDTLYLWLFWWEQ